MKKIGFKTLESKIKKENLYLSNDIEIKSKTYKDFLYDFLIEYNNISPTYIKHLDHYIIHTNSNKRRSLGDIYNICKTYYPDVTLKEIITELYTLCKTKQGFRTSYCYNISKRVFYYDSFHSNVIMNCEQKDEYNHDIQYYMDRINISVEDD